MLIPPHVEDVGRATAIALAAAEDGNVPECRAVEQRPAGAHLTHGPRGVCDKAGGRAAGGQGRGMAGRCVSGQPPGNGSGESAGGGMRQSVFTHNTREQT